MAIIGSGMRPAAAKAWPAFCASWEGRCEWLYLDTKKLPTTGLGHRVFTVADMVALPWLTKDGTPATDAQKRTEWTRIGARTDLAPKGGYAYQSVATLHLSDATVDGLLTSDTPAYWDPLVKVLPDLPTWPADAQLAIIDLAYNVGAYFLGDKWPNFTKAAKAGDFTGMATYCLRAIKSPRDYRHQRLFTNAATVVKVGADPNVLWDATTPIAPAKPPVVVPPVTPPPEEFPDVAKVQFRGGWTCSCVTTSLPLVEAELKRKGLIKNSVDIYQLGYRNDVGASAGTHAAGGNTDVAQFSDAQIQVWRECGWTIQHRTKAMGFSMDHGHGWPWGCTHLSPAGRDQAAQWQKRQNGLVSHGPISGKWPVPNWKNAADDLIAAQKKRDAAAAAAKELELPTTAEVVKALTTDKNFLAAVAEQVLNEDAVPNEWADKDADPTVKGSVPNPTISLKTSQRRNDKLALATAAKIDALTAAVAAAFPKPPAA